MAAPCSLPSGASSSTKDSSHTKATAPASSAIDRNDDLKEAPLQKNTSPTATARESNEQPVTARPSRRSDPRSSPLLLSRSARAATVVVIIRSDWCILNLSGLSAVNGLHLVTTLTHPRGCDFPRNRKDTASISKAGPRRHHTHRTHRYCVMD